jgi:HK97 family phage major capsid protein
MWQKIKALREERGQLVNDMKSVMKKSEDEKRDMSADESAKFDELKGKVAAKDKELQRFEEVYELERAGEKRILVEGDGNGEGSSGVKTADLKQYSLLRAIRCLMNNRAVDGFEREVSDEIAKRSGKQPQGFYFPTEVAFERRDLNLTTGSGAKPTITDASNFIELLRNRTVVNQLGARLLTGLTGDLSLPKQSAGATAYWVTEGNAPTESNATITQVGLNPRTVGAFTDLSRKFILQSAVSAEDFARQDLATVMAIAIDAAALNGNVGGSGADPTGLLNNTNVTTHPLGTNGAALAFSDMVAMETAVAAANADAGSMAYVTNAKVRGALRTTQKATNQAIFVWDEDNTVNGYRSLVTNSMPSSLTKGSGTGLSSALFGNWNDLIIGFWSGLDILVDPYNQSTSGTVRVVALQDCDIKTRHDESFSKIVDIIA